MCWKLACSCFYFYSSIRSGSLGMVKDFILNHQSIFKARQDEEKKHYKQKTTLTFSYFFYYQCIVIVQLFPKGVIDKMSFIQVNHKSNSAKIAAQKAERKKMWKRHSKSSCSSLVLTCLSLSLLKIFVQCRPVSGCREELTLTLWMTGGTDPCPSCSIIHLT